MAKELSPLDPDVAGPGVIIGFIFTGATTLVVSIILLRLDTHTKNSSSQTPPRSIFIKKLAKTLAPRTVSDPLQFWKSVLERLVLGLSDQQLLTGLLLLPIALAKYWPQSERANLYYTANLAYFSSITHAATLLALRECCRRYFWMTLFRLVLTGTSFILWAFVGTEVINNTFNEGAGQLIWWSPVTRGGLLAELVSLGWIYLSLGVSLHVSEKALISRAAVSKRGSKRDLAAVPEWLNELEEWNSELAKMFSKLYDVYANTKSTVLCGAIWIVVELAYPWILLMPLLILMFVLCLVILSLLLGGDTGIGSQWGFGQFLTMFLIFLPFYQLVERYVEERRPEEGLRVARRLHHLAPVHKLP